MKTLFFIIIIFTIHNDNVKPTKKLSRKMYPKQQLLRENQTKLRNYVKDHHQNSCDYCKVSPHNTYCLHR